MSAGHTPVADHASTEPSVAQPGAVRVLGVRHHSPACARLVDAVIRDWQPTAVCIEGPADFSPRIGELLLEHTLPLAVFSFVHHAPGTGPDDAGASGTRALSWSPFCAYSPEWVALQAGHAAGAALSFIDVPMWAKALARADRPDRENRYADRAAPTFDHVKALCTRFGCAGYDALWDQLFEQPLAPDALAARLDAYFAELRPTVEASLPPSDAVREEFMAAHVHHTRQTSPRVLVVCGGLHKPALEARLKALEGQPAARPDVPGAPDGAKFGSYLVPYSFARLDAFTGYQSGMPSPGFYQHVWDKGPAEAAAFTMRTVQRRLRGLKQPVSTADLIAAETMTGGLQAMRGHAVATRTDILDGMASALVKDALDVRLPWSHRGHIEAGTHPLLVEVLKALSGDARGSLDPTTPHPPLVQSVQDTLERLGVSMRPGRTTLELDRETADGRETSALFARLCALDVPGFVRADAQRARLSGHSAVERWHVEPSLDFTAALIEASAWGGTLELAVSAKLQSEIAQAGGVLDAVVHALGVALACELHALFDVLVHDAMHAIEDCHDTSAVGGALDVVRWALAATAPDERADSHVDARVHGPLAALLVALAGHQTRLLEAMRGAGDKADEPTVAAVAALYGATRFMAQASDAGNTADPAVRDTASTDTAGYADAVRLAQNGMERALLDADCPPAVRGGALGLLWAHADTSADDAMADLEHTVSAATSPETLGDFLAGLFGVAREQVRVDGTLARLVDRAVLDMTEPAFLDALPSLRLAFQYFPRPERARIAQHIASSHGFERQAHTLLGAVADQHVLQDAQRLEAAVAARMAHYGIGNGPSSPGGSA